MTNINVKDLMNYVVENECIYVPYGDTCAIAHFECGPKGEYYLIDKYNKNAELFEHDGQIKYVPEYDEVKCEYSLSDVVEHMVQFIRNEL